MIDGLPGHSKAKAHFQGLKKPMTSAKLHEKSFEIAHFAVAKPPWLS
jgi:hypothetical protein